MRQFATSANIEIMIINIDAFKKAENIINQQQDRLNGETAMRYIQDTNPVVIIDEPQSVDNTPKAKEAVASLSPLCVLRYSATHREKINLLYRLTPVDAYQMGLVKQICVSSNTVSGDFNQPYIRLGSVSNEKGFSARVELDVKGKNGVVSRKTVLVKPGADLFLLSGERELYEGYVVSGIDCTPEYECIEFANTESIRLGKAIGDINETIIKRAQIRRTIEAHLDKELRYLDKDIKVLSLFFIDEVAKYRTAKGGPGIYAQLFEEGYQELLARPKYEPLRNRFDSDVSRAHDGYFSQDKKGNYKNTRGDTPDDYSTYNTIMRDKEWLLSFDCPLRFIFSHQALKEGWDNPNVFQVCTLIEQKSAFTCRQKVGRGLRLCVNQDGERIEDKNINVLHVMANENFAEFADTLQKEIEQETGVRFGALQISLFSGLVYPETIVEEKTISPELSENLISQLQDKGYVAPSGAILRSLKDAVKAHEVGLAAELAPDIEQLLERAETHDKIDAGILSSIPIATTVTVEKTVTYDEAKELMDHFEEKGYISKSGKMKDTMKEALKNGTLDLPQKLEAARERFETVISKADKGVPIRDASKNVLVRLNKEVMVSPEFLELWDQIKQKTAYRVNVDSSELVRRCIKELSAMQPIPPARILSQTADIHIEYAGVSLTERGIRTTDLGEQRRPMPDILLILQEECGIPLKLGCDILLKSGRLQDFVNNPQLFIELVVPLIKNAIWQFEIDGIRYMKLAGEEYYLQEVFDSEELLANLDKNAVPVSRSVYDHVIYDSETVERPFAVALDNDPDVKMFFKIPSKFKIDTPLGTYNPDWAVYLTRNGEQKLYFVLETKGSTSLLDLRTAEQLKIHCGEQHFKALENDIELRRAKSWKEFKIMI